MEAGRRERRSKSYSFIYLVFNWWVSGCVRIIQGRYFVVVVILEAVRCGRHGHIPRMKSRSFIPDSGFVFRVHREQSRVQNSSNFGSRFFLR